MKGYGRLEKQFYPLTNRKYIAEWICPYNCQLESALQCHSTSGFFSLYVLLHLQLQCTKWSTENNNSKMLLLPLTVAVMSSKSSTYNHQTQRDTYTLFQMHCLLRLSKSMCMHQSSLSLPFTLFLLSFGPSLLFFGVAYTPHYTWYLVWHCKRVTVKILLVSSIHFFPSTPLFLSLSLFLFLFLSFSLLFLYMRSIKSTCKYRH